MRKIYEETINKLESKINTETEKMRYRLAVGYVRAAWDSYLIRIDFEDIIKSNSDIKTLGMYGMDELNTMCGMKAIEPVIDTSEDNWLESLRILENIYNEKETDLHIIPDG